MSNWMIALMFGIGVAGFAYSKLVRATGNPNPRSSFIGAGVAGVIAFLFLFTLFKFIFNF